MVTRTDRQRGTMWGLAVGDALGAAVEFRRPGSFEPVTGYRGGGPHRLGPGEWTDDTSMALALADSIAHVGWDLDDQAARYVRWWQDGRYSVNGQCFDIGNTTVAALRRYLHSKDARNSGGTETHSAGNGSIMRLAPVPVRYAHLLSDRILALVERASESSLPTHASPACVAACVYMTVVISGLIEGHSRAEVLEPSWPPMRRARDISPFPPEIEEVADGSFRRKSPPEITGSGYVVRTLEAALWAFHAAEDFREAVLRVVNLGEDADTTGAVCGQFAGAWWGESGIPQEWREDLARPDLLEEALEGLL